MINYYETRSQPITRVMVWQAYKKVKASKGSAGIDGMDWEALDSNLKPSLYKLWNRLSSGSYFPMPVKEVAIRKKSGGERKLGIPTILDRIAQQVVKNHLERRLEPIFHRSSFGYRPSKNAHQAVEQAERNTFKHNFAVDLDIQSFFDTINHELLLKSVRHYCRDRWVLLYVKRWLKAGIVQQDGMYMDRLTGTPQGGVISPLLANLYLHVAFDQWMEKNHPDKPFERYADDIVVHCKTEGQADSVLEAIRHRLASCRLSLHPEKSKIVCVRGTSRKKYPRSYNFLGFTVRPVWRKLLEGFALIPNTFISRKSINSVVEKFRMMQIHKRRIPIEELAKELSPVIRGVMNYYCKKWAGHTRCIWKILNMRLLKWVKWERGLYKRSSARWLKNKYKENPGLFPHWKLVHP